MKAREHKRTYYGVPIGILMLDSKFERFNGDIGNAQTWPFPVQYKIVRGAVPNKVVDTLNNRHLFQLFADAADELIADGVDGITTTCGFLALYQQELAAHCSVPVATSALLQVPMVARVLPKGKRPGILTFSAESLTMHHLAAVGIDPDTPVVGLPTTSEFQRSIREGDDTVPFEVLKNEVLDTAERMLEGRSVNRRDRVRVHQHHALLARDQPPPRRAGVRHGHAGALVSSRAATTAFPARLIASGIGLTGACPRRRPTASSGTFSA